MKKICLFLFLSISMSVLIGCNNQAKQEKEIDELLQMANQYREDGKLKDAIVLYNKALDLKEDENVRGKLNETETEKSNVEIATGFIETFLEIERYYLQESEIDITQVKIQEAVGKMRVAFDEFEKANISGDTEIAIFIEELQNSGDYKSLKTYVENNITDDGERMDSLALVYSDFDVLNQIGSGLFVDIYGRNMKNIAKMKIPNRYHE